MGIFNRGYRFADMICMELRTNLPEGFDMLVMASKRVLAEVSGTGIIGLAMPLKVHELVNTVGMMSQNVLRRKKKRREKPSVRNQEE